MFNCACLEVCCAKNRRPALADIFANVATSEHEERRGDIAVEGLA